MLGPIKRLFQPGEIPEAPAGRRGAAGEEAAARYLRRACGMRVVARNWRDPRDARREIDLVCRDGDVLVFVEVKTRPAAGLVRGFRSVDRRKRRTLGRAINAYLARLRVRPPTYRLDVVEVVTRTGAPPEFLHFANVALARPPRPGRTHGRRPRSL